MTETTIRESIVRLWPTLTPQQVEEGVEKELKIRASMNRKANAITLVNLALFLIFIFLTVMFVVRIFQGNWPHVAGFFVLDFMTFVIFVLVPNSKYPLDGRLYIDNSLETAFAEIRKIGRRVM